MQPFIVTLAMMVFARGLAKFASSGQKISTYRQQEDNSTQILELPAIFNLLDMRVLGGKWTGSILWHLKDGPVRFNDLARMIVGASKKMITDRLRQLVERGLVHREVLDTSPVSVQYEITDFGRTALGVLDELRIWSERLPGK